MSCSLKAVAQDILLSREAYRNFCLFREVCGYEKFVHEDSSE